MSAQVVKQGDDGEELFIIRSGEVSVLASKDVSQGCVKKRPQNSNMFHAESGWKSSKESRQLEGQHLNPIWNDQAWHECRA